ncbi:hypothetical protein COE53_06750 [Bacillus sp. AFS029533]|uniref:Uncharacterized protein n=1 Tax=Gottfriedia luciferensis TaxID=178774 RepID=A0ABX2ZUQ8_9BACI|nr:hypothetical protein BED47_04140 [Gottfriedia luciferensis]PGZ93394.1 hypothetical protein COE53_06750 [Bacillus sp. AFS029533]
MSNEVKEECKKDLEGLHVFLIVIVFSCLQYFFHLSDFIMLILSVLYVFIIVYFVDKWKTKEILRYFTLLIIVYFINKLFFL